MLWLMQCNENTALFRTLFIPDIGEEWSALLLRILQFSGHCQPGYGSVTFLTSSKQMRSGRFSAYRFNSSFTVTLPIVLILPAALGPAVYSASNRNDYQKQKKNVCGE
jgi:hypothetical protein